ncbi:MAG: hypothetical protein Q4G69_10305 [Planctomycetia bacterium]|nr:hypothetical protein [Planctomycetia bacterium]
MEILVVVLAEFLAGLILPVFFIFLNFIGLIFQSLFLVLEFFFELFLNRKKKSSPDKSALTAEGKTEGGSPDSQTDRKESVKTAPRTAPKRRLHKIAVWGSSICLLIFLVPIAVFIFANSFFVSSAARMLLVPIEKKTGYEIRFEKAKGDLFSGKIELDTVSVVRKDHLVSQVDLKIKEVMVDISWSDLKEKRLVFEKVDLDHITGRWEQIAKPDKLKPRRDYLIHDLDLSDVQIDFEDRSNAIHPFDLKLRINSAQVHSMRSDWAIYDFLSRSNVLGTVNEIPFQIVSTSGENQCRMSDIPADGIFAFTGNLLNYVDTGKLDVQIIQKPLPEGKIDMEWSLLLRDYSVRIPDSGNSKIRIALIPLQVFMKEKAKDLPLNFHFRLEEKIFRYSSSEELMENIRIMISEKLMDQMKKIPLNF